MTKRSMKRTWVLILEIDTNEVAVVSLPAGQRPNADRQFRCHGPFKSKIAAINALKQKSSALKQTFYENGKQFVAKGDNTV